MKRFSISVWLTALLILLFLPLFIFFLFLIGQLKISEDEAMERRTLRTAATVSQGVHSIIENMSLTLNLVSSAQELVVGDLEAFHSKTQFALKESPNFIIVVEENGQQLLNTRVPYGTKLGATSDLKSLNAALSKAEIHVSGAFKGKTSGRWVFNVIKSLPPTYASAARAVITTRNAEELETVFHSLMLPDEWVASVVDGAGNVVVSSDRLKQASGDKIEDVAFANPDENFTSIQQSKFMRDDGMVTAIAKVSGTDWTVLVQGPASTAQDSVYETWQIVIIGSVVLALVSVFVFYLFSIYLRKSIRDIARMAKHLATGEIVSPVSSRITEIDLVAKAISDASFDRSQREDKITMVMRELAHRTKNLIAVVISMVRQTSRRTSSREAMTKSLIDRVMGLGFSIDLLTDTQWGGVSLDELLTKQLSNFGTIGQNIITRGPGVKLRAEAVQHLGMAIHELATNAAKHGSLAVTKGVVNVTWEINGMGDEKTFKFVWQEVGGKKVRAPEETGFGLQILERYAASTLSGKSTLDFASSGLVWTLEAPAKEVEDDKAAG
ncbi:sensor histidine kinase [Ahrensia marina]|uniref:sensor histidine kinase n=1 Tax=Ahrensia marina TaxID=1514904 RepID=UPI000AE33B72|nr:sensor histidine kinase [Ahrensia marina]